MTIQQTIIKTLKDVNIAISAEDILNHINKNNYYFFGAQHPIQAIRPELTKLFNNNKIARAKKGKVYFYTLKD